MALWLGLGLREAGLSLLWGQGRWNGKRNLVDCWALRFLERIGLAGPAPNLGRDLVWGSRETEAVHWEDKQKRWMLQ